MKQEIVSTAKRTARVGFATLIAGVISQLTGEPKFMLLVPVISGIGKLLRGFFNLPKLPF